MEGGLEVGKDFRGSPLVGCVVEVSTKLKVFEKGVLLPTLKRVFVPHLLKKGFCVPLCHEKTLPKIESRVEKVADLLDYLQDYSDTSLQGESWRV